MSDEPHSIKDHFEEWKLNASIAAGVALAVGYGFHWFGGEGWLQTLALVLFLVSLGIGLVYGAIAAWEAISELDPNIDVLMVVGAIMAAALGHPEEGALLLFLFVLSAALEERAMERTTATVRALTSMIPDTTLVRRGDQWIECTPEELAKGDVVLVRPGERAPVDGRVVTGKTSFNQASLTGEPMPRVVEVDDDVFEGTINEENPVEIEVTKPAADSSLHRVLNLVTHAQEARQPVQQLIDRLSRPYTIAVFAVAGAVLILYWLALGRAWHDAAYISITLLVVASPCALVIATPTATLSAISRAARFGVLFKGGDALIRMAIVNAAAFDKTGTLTRGRPHVIAMHPIAWSNEEELLSLAAGLETGSTHPIGTAILVAAAERGVDLKPTTEMTFQPGGGVSGEYEGHEIRLGRYSHVERLIPICLQAQIRDILADVQGAGRMAVVIAWNEQAGVFVLDDEARTGACSMVDRLHQINVRPVVMLTGDVKEAAERVAKRIGIDEIRAELLPEEKLSIVRDLKEKHGRFAVIGDGVNDAPALAASDAGIAIGGIGSDAAIETADVILTNEDLRVIPWAIALARSARRIMAFNLTFAISAIILLAIGTLTGYVNLVLGVIGHEGGTLFVVANALRLFIYRSPDLPAEPCDDLHASDELTNESMRAPRARESVAAVAS